MRFLFKPEQRASNGLNSISNRMPIGRFSGYAIQKRDFIMRVLYTGFNILNVNLNQDVCILLKIDIRQNDNSYEQKSNRIR